MVNAADAEEISIACRRLARQPSSQCQPIDRCRGVHLYSVVSGCQRHAPAIDGPYKSARQRASVSEVTAVCQGFGLKGRIRGEASSGFSRATTHRTVPLSQPPMTVLGWEIRTLGRRHRVGRVSSRARGAVAGPGKAPSSCWPYGERRHQRLDQSLVALSAYRTNDGDVVDTGIPAAGPTDLERCRAAVQ